MNYFAATFNPDGIDEEPINGRGKVERHIAKPVDNRILIVDALRGFCLVLMTIGHLPENPLWRIANVLYGPVGLFTAGSGFVFLGGWVAGRVYGGRRKKYGRELLNRHLLSRSSSFIWRK